jgi:BirA family transcriptional regulator, biotin operon repressor / biotin---[acetyl-CoA-carboxylase] ligase
MQIGRKLIHLESVDSTNNYTANLIKSEGLTSGTVILADEQFSGRGQRGTEWLVEPGMNLTFSIYLELVNLSVENQFDLSKTVALSICHFMEKNGIDANVKWPNDIYVGGKKIAGVLIENSFAYSRPLRSIIGIGINVNQTEFGEMNATSMRAQTGNYHSVGDALFSFIESFNAFSDDLMNKSEELHSAYLAKLHQFGELKAYSDAEGEFEGEICGIEPSGKLIVRKNDSEVSYDLKEIVFL